MDIPERPSLQREAVASESTNSQMPFVFQSSSSSLSEMQIYSAPLSLSTQNYPYALDEGFYAQDILHDIPEHKNPPPPPPPPTDEDDTLMTLLDQEIEFYIRSAAAADVSYQARYFDDEDLYGMAGAPVHTDYLYEYDYDYPRGIDDDIDDAEDKDDDEEEEEDSYTRDPDLRAIFEQSTLHDRRDKWDTFEWGSIDEISNAQYFDAMELYHRAEFPASVYFEDTTDVEIESDASTSGESETELDYRRYWSSGGLGDGSRGVDRGGMVLAGLGGGELMVFKPLAGETVSRHSLGARKFFI